MPHIIETKAFYFEELDNEAKENARRWWRESGPDYDWWDNLFEDFKQIMDILGFFDVLPMFSGFGNQGDGACFTSRYQYAPGWRKKLREYLRDEDLQFFERIGEALQEMQRPHMYGLLGRITHRGHYYYEFSMYGELEHEQDYRYVDPTQFTNICREIARYLYRKLEKLYEYLNSDENVDAQIIINEYEFDERGFKL